MNKPKDIVSLVGKAKNRVVCVGIELEGGWDSPTAAKAIMRDGSVQFPLPPPTPPGQEPPSYPKYVGEIASPPTKVEDINEWMKKWYPKYVNATCGLHVHMSFKSARPYHLLLCPEFTEVMLTELARWAMMRGLQPDHPIWPRLAGNNPTCAREFKGDQQAAATRKVYAGHPGACRYTAINYPVKLHSTVECRVLPMFDGWRLGAEAVHRVIEITNAFVAGVARREPKVPIMVMGDGQTADLGLVGYV